MRSLLLSLAVLAACGTKPSPVPDAGPSLARYPMVPNSGGTVLADANLISVTLGPDTMGHADFLKRLVASNWLIERGGEYGVTGVSFGSAIELAVPGGDLIHDAELRELLRAGLTLEKKTLYVVWLPQGLALGDRYGARTCFPNPGAGYHESFDAEDVPYVAMPACPARFGAKLDQAQSLHLDATRLILDALTNPSPRNAPTWALSDPAVGWAGLGTEIGDFCWGRLTLAGTDTVQRVWSNAANARGEEPCLPAPAGPSFGFVVEPSGRRTIGIAEPIQLTVRGWSTAPMEDWAVQVIPWAGDFGMTVSIEPATLNDGKTATLTIEVPYLEAPGTAGAVLLRAIGPEDVPQWPVGILVR